MRKQQTHDKEAVYAVTKLGRTQSLTPEGFLLCTDVPIARTGTMLYGPNETPIEPGRDGIARVTRDAATLFSDVTIASSNGKPVVNDHPNEDVRPENWREHTVGIMLNPCRGTNGNRDEMLADLLITDAATIREVKAGKREVSLGYEADYEQTGEGEGRQTNIIVNHVALVERGRCGPRCSIGDHESEFTTSLKENLMGIKVTARRRISDKAMTALRKVFHDAEEEALNQLGNSGLPEGGGMDGDEPGDEPDDEEGNHTHIHIHTGEASGEAAPTPTPAAPAAAAEEMNAENDPIEARFKAIEQALAQIMQMLQGGGEEAQPAEEGGEEAQPAEEELPTHDRRTVDSAALSTTWRNLISDAEVLVPGFRVPTFDSALPRKITIDSMCKLRKSVLDHMAATAAGKAVLNNVMPEGTNFATLDCATAATIYKAAAGAQRILNNRAAVGDGRLPSLINSSNRPVAVTTLADLNRLHSEYYSKTKK